MLLLGPSKRLPFPLTKAQAELTEPEVEVEPCYPAFVFLDNKSTESYSEFTVEVKDYPGLLRVVAWVLNGLSCRVHNAVLKTIEDGTAQDVFWVTDLQGRKLSDTRAADVADRLQDFVTYCAPPSEVGEFQEYKCGNMFISNMIHKDCTIARITADLYSPGLLFDLASVINGQGIAVAQAIIRGGEENPIKDEHLLLEMGEVPAAPPGKRVIQMWLQEVNSKQKLDYADVSALIYTLRLAMGQGNLSMTPPDADISAITCACPDDE